jgi:hypothetical protein
LDRTTRVDAALNVQITSTWLENRGPSQDIRGHARRANRLQTHRFQ